MRSTYLRLFAELSFFLEPVYFRGKFIPNGIQAEATKKGVGKKQAL